MSTITNVLKQVQERVQEYYVIDKPIRSNFNYEILNHMPTYGLQDIAMCREMINFLRFEHGLVPGQYSRQNLRNMVNMSKGIVAKRLRGSNLYIES